MKNPTTLFTFLTGVLFTHLIGHVWLDIEGFLPLTSNILNYTLTPEANRYVIAVNGVLLLFCAYFAFSHKWNKEVRTRRKHAKTIRRATNILLALFLFLAIGAASRTPAQCIDSERGETAIVLNNASSYETLFYVDMVLRDILPAHTVGRPIPVSSGEHLLGAKALIPDQELWVFSVNTLPAGKTCTWTVVDHDAEVNVNAEWRGGMQ